MSAKAFFRRNLFGSTTLICLFLVIYIASAKFGLWLAATGGGYAAPVWPPTGIALAIVFTWGFRLTPVVVFAAFLVNFQIAGTFTANNFLGSLLIATGNGMEAIVATLLLKRTLGFSPRFFRLSDAVGLGTAAAIGSSLSASFGLLGIWIIHRDPMSVEYVKTWVTWWTGDLLGAFVITPILLTTLHSKQPYFHKSDRLVDLTYFSVILTICILTFLEIIPNDIKSFSVAFSIYAALIWCALRFSIKGLSLALGISALATTIASHYGFSFFTTVKDPTQNLLILQFFLGCSVITLTVLNILMTERLTALKLLGNREATLLNTAKISALGKLARGVAHEVNNPLSVILGQAGLLKELAESDSADSTTIATAASNIEITSLRIAKIVKSLQTFSKDSGKEPLEYTTVNSIISRTLDLCQTQFQNHGFTLTIDPVPDSAGIECRPLQIIEALLNILNNAHDATEASSPRWVRISTQELGEFVEISVTDSGNGISTHIQDKIFEPFFSTRAIGKGTGLGLSVSLGIVESHRGTLTLDTKNQNTCFVIRLPQAKPNQKEPAQSGLR